MATRREYFKANPRAANIWILCRELGLTPAEVGELTPVQVEWLLAGLDFYIWVRGEEGQRWLRRNS